MDELEKVDILRERLGISYREALDALAAANGDVLEALARLEERDGPWADRLQRGGKRLLGEVRQLVGRAAESRIRITKNGRTVAEVPAAVGALGVLGALASTPLAIVAGAGALAGWLNDYHLEVDPPERDGQRSE